VKLLIGKEMSGEWPRFQPPLVGGVLPTPSHR
jgi:hypothetical protein